MASVRQTIYRLTINEPGIEDYGGEPGARDGYRRVYNEVYGNTSKKRKKK